MIPDIVYTSMSWFIVTICICATIVCYEPKNMARPLFVTAVLYVVMSTALCMMSIDLIIATVLFISQLVLMCYFYACLMNNVNAVILNSKNIRFRFPKSIYRLGSYSDSCILLSFIILSYQILNKESISLLYASVILVLTLIAFLVNDRVFIKVTKVG